MAGPSRKRQRPNRTETESEREPTQSATASPDPPIMNNVEPQVQQNTTTQHEPAQKKRKVVLSKKKIYRIIKERHLDLKVLPSDELVHQYHKDIGDNFPTSLEKSYNQIAEALNNSRKKGARKTPMYQPGFPDETRFPTPKNKRRGSTKKKTDPKTPNTGKQGMAQLAKEGKDRDPKGESQGQEDHSLVEDHEQEDQEQEGLLLEDHEPEEPEEDIEQGYTFQDGLNPSDGLLSKFPTLPRTRKGKLVTVGELRESLFQTCLRGIQEMAQGEVEQGVDRFLRWFDRRFLPSNPGMQPTVHNTIPSPDPITPQVIHTDLTRFTVMRLHIGEVVPLPKSVLEHHYRQYPQRLITFPPGNSQECQTFSIKTVFSRQD